MRRALLGAVILALLGSVACRRTSGKIAACEEFLGSDARATWRRCPDGKTREISCRDSPGTPRRCDCMEGPVSQWFFFTGGNPPLGSRADGERVANQNCPMWSH